MFLIYYGFPVCNDDLMNLKSRGEKRRVTIPVFMIDTDNVSKKNLNSILGASLQKSIMLRVLQQVKKLRVNNRHSTLHPSMHRKLLKDYIASLQAYTTLFLSFVNPDVSTYINYLSKPHHPDTRCSMHTLLNL